MSAALKKLLKIGFKVTSRVNEDKEEEKISVTTKL